MNRIGASIGVIILGIWLFISAFLWPHTQAQFTNAWIVGLIAVALGLIALAAQPVRFVNTLLAIWLFISAWVLPTQMVGTQWNSVIVAILLFLLSLAPGTTGIQRRRAVV